MSAEDGAEQVAAAAPDKAQAPKAAATFSSFINKNTTGKKFAPKAARRRPAAAPVAAPPQSPAPEPAAEPSAPQSQSQTEPAASTADSVEPPAEQQLPTPAATQEVAAQQTSVPDPSTSEDSVNVAVAAPAQPDPAPGPLPTPASPAIEAPAEAVVHAQDTPVITDTDTSPAQSLQDGRGGNDVRSQTLNEPIAPGTSERAIGNNITTTESQKTNAPPEVAQAQAASLDEGQPEPVPAVEQQEVETVAPRQTRRRRYLPWTAVNDPPEDEDEDDAPAPVPPKKPTRTRGRRVVAAESSTVNNEEGQGEDNEAAAPVRKKPVMRGRSKRKTAEANEEDVQDPPVKKPRKPRKPKETPVVAEGNEGGDAMEAGTEAVEAEATPAHRKPRAPKRRKRAATEVEGTQKDESVPAKRRGRPPREATPSDASEHEIDPNDTFMDGLASRNIRVGKLSVRERKMREINWVEVKERWREEDTRKIKSKEEQRKADEAAAEAAANQDQPSQSAVKYVEVNGTIQMVQESGILDREAEADREIAGYEVIETQDLTTRITKRSFLKNNRRFPNDFVLPGQGMRWNAEMTDLFYQGLKSFGTDFQMISRMFPGYSRRSIKTKFTREEKENPTAVKVALQGRVELVSNWDMFLEASQLQEESFPDVDRVKKEMKEYEAQMQVKIDKAKLEAEERLRQREAAGLLNGEHEGDGKENGKGKRKKKGKQVAFEDEPGVEIVGDAEGWAEEQL